MKKQLVKLLKLTVRLALIAALAVGGWYAYRYYVPQEEEDPLGELPTAVADVRDITVSVQATGVLQPIKVVEIKSKASGEILAMPVEMGDHVRAGDLIAQIDTAILDQELKQAQADHESAKVRLEIADNQYRRARSLFDQDLISENDLESSQQNYTGAEAQLLRNEAALELAKERLADATVRAPSDGVIINKAVEEGQIIASSTNNVSGGTTLVQMANLTELEIRTLVDEVDIGQVRPGLEVESTVEAFADERFTGHVIKIEPQAVVQQSVTTFPVISRIGNADGKLLPGMNADVSIIIYRKPQVLALPNEAVRSVTDATEVKRMLGLIPNEPGAGMAGGGDAGRGNPGATGGQGQGRGGGTRGSGQPGAAGSAMQRSTGGGSGPPASRGSRGSSPGGRGGASGAGRNGVGGSPPGEDGEGGDDGAPGSMRGAPADPDPFGVQGRREPAVVFLYDATGKLTTKDIVVGVRDWEYVEIVDGLSAGETVLVLPSNSLLRSQDRLRQWAQGRAGGLPGMGGGGGGRPPGGGGGRGPRGGGGRGR